MKISTNATPAGGLKESPGLAHVHHAHSAHVYVVHWPKRGILKIGLSTKVRWNAWRSLGAAEIATIDTCCIPHAHRIEQWLLKILAQHGAPAFQRSSDAAQVLGRRGIGFSECYELAPSPLMGQPADDPYDYARGYGLALPDELQQAISRYNPAWHPVVAITGGRRD